MLENIFVAKFQELLLEVAAKVYIRFMFGNNESANIYYNDGKN